jgi:hypothetical protein
MEPHPRNSQIDWASHQNYHNGLLAEEEEENKNLFPQHHPYHPCTLLIVCLFCCYHPSLSTIIPAASADVLDIDIVNSGGNTGLWTDIAHRSNCKYRYTGCKVSSKELAVEGGEALQGDVNIMFDRQAHSERGSPSLVGRGIANPMSERTRGFEMSRGKS